MSKKRLQVLMEVRELKEIRRAAKQMEQTVSEWVRGTLREGYHRRPKGSQAKKLEVVRAAARYDFPAPDVEQMNAEITKSYASGWEP